MATKQFLSLPIIPKTGTKGLDFVKYPPNHSTQKSSQVPPIGQLLPAPVSKIQLFSNLPYQSPNGKRKKERNFRICIPGQHTISNREDTNDTLGPVLWQERGRYGGTGPGVNK